MGYCSFYLPTEGRRLSRPSWQTSHRDGLAARRQSPIAVLTRPGLEFHWLDETHYRCTMPPTRDQLYNSHFLTMISSLHWSLYWVSRTLHIHFNTIPLCSTLCLVSLVSVTKKVFESGVSHNVIAFIKDTLVCNVAFTLAWSLQFFIV